MCRNNSGRNGDSEGWWSIWLTFLLLTALWLIDTDDILDWYFITYCDNISQKQSSNSCQLKTKKDYDP